MYPIVTHLHSLDRLKLVDDLRRLGRAAAAQLAELVVVAPAVDGARGGARQVEPVAAGGTGGSAAADVHHPLPEAADRQGGL